MCIVAAEMIGAKGGGVGLYILNQANIGRYDYMFAGMVVIAILGLLSVEVAGYIERFTAKRMGARK
jgi:ABC-type nitrate/sulfonate/bicarbonate transport system permease component